MSARGILALLLPRPMDLLVKGPILLVAAWLAASSPRSEGASWPTILLAWVAVELLGYQARYVVNDLVDWARDRAHPAARGRARLLGIDERWLPAVGAVALLRGSAALALALVIDDQSTSILALIAIGACAAIYEPARNVVRRGDVSLADAGHRRMRHDAIYVLVGLGYAVRIGAGLRLGGVDDVGVLVLGAALGVPYGTMFVTMTWALEATSFAAGGTYIDAAVGKSHVTVLGDLARRNRGPFDSRSRVLMPRPVLSAPWVWATALAGALGAAVGVALDGSAATGPIAAAGLAGAASGWAVSWSAPWGRTVAVGVVALILTFGVGWLVFDAGVLAIAPLVIVLGTHIAFRALCAADIGLRPPAIQAAARPA